MLFSLIGTALKGVMGYFNDKAAIKKAVLERKDELKKLELTAKLEGIKKAQFSDTELDITERKNAGWMDDFSFLVFMIPALLSFFPPAIPYVKQGFEALESMPQWYQYALGGMLVAVWGYRRLVTPIVEFFIKKAMGGK